MHFNSVFVMACIVSEQVRLDAFHLVCDNVRTTETIGSVEFKYVRHFLSTNLNNQSSAFRQSMLTSIKKVNIILFLIIYCVLIGLLWNIECYNCTSTFVSVECLTNGASVFYRIL